MILNTVEIGTQLGPREGSCKNIYKPLIYYVYFFALLRQHIPFLLFQKVSITKNQLLIVSIYVPISSLIY